MKKAIICLLLMLVLVAACEPHVQQTVRERASAFVSWAAQRGGWTVKREGTQAPSFSDQLGGQERSDMLGVTLYYRFAQTGLLGAQRVQMDIRREETVATRIVEQLIAGPDLSHAKLGGVFPQGTTLISVTGDGATAFVTLSREFLGRPDGAPADWEDLPNWQEEATKRRLLAVQSIVLSLTEDGRYQRVQLFVASNDDDVPERIPMAYFSQAVTDPTLLLAASGRDEQAMLTPGRAMNMILEAWRERDWDALYPLMTKGEDDDLPSQNIFAAEMNRIDVSLLTYSTTPGTVSFDGQTATMVVDAQLHSREGGDAQITREAVPLRRVDDNWAIETDVLRSLMIRD